MSNANDFEAKLWAVLAREHLVDLSQFHKRNFYDEVPLFSRKSDINFLSKCTSSRANSILLNFAIKFLKAVVYYQEHRSAYFAAVTVWSFTDSERLVPNLFVWSGPIGPLEQKLVLDVVRTPFGRKMKQLVSGVNVLKGFDVLEDTLTDPSETRVFLSFSRPPYDSFAPLGTFRKTNHVDLAN